MQPRPRPPSFRVVSHRIGAPFKCELLGVPPVGCKVDNRTERLHIVVSGARKLTACAVALAAGILGPASLVIFAAFLWTGPFELVNLRMTEPGMLAWDAALCLVFFIQHSVMLRKSFRTRMHRWLPDYWSGVIYTIASAIALMLLVSTWQRSDVTFYAASAHERVLLGTILLLSLAGVLWGIRALGDFDAFGIQSFLSGFAKRHSARRRSPSRDRTESSGTPSTRSPS